ncbi:unnamed protein product [Caenorhabditis angaria]|uniref:Phosphatase and actin regulator n=1 Tax=Caenorhabditis angaria TaxID=860376 RepID=A0A9P1I981_9PELO|nr:unnamed protein product [Caenorhabditis angaria]
MKNIDVIDRIMGSGRVSRYSEQEYWKFPIVRLEKDPPPSTSQTLQIVKNPSDQMTTNAENVTKSPRTTRQNHSHRRKIPFATSKFWLRLVRPWKWRNLKRKVRRSDSERSSTRHHRVVGDAPVTSPSLPELSQISREQEEEEKACEAITYRPVCSENSSTPQPVIVDVEKISKIRAQIYTPSPSQSTTVLRTTVVQIKGENPAIFNAPPPPPHQILPSLLIHPPQCSSRDAGDSDEENIAYDQSTEDESEEMSSTRRGGEISPQTSRMLKEGYRRIEAREPNFQAQPDKPVLKKPGQPSRLKLNNNNEDLPDKLTDDSDSDEPIQYREAEPATHAEAEAEAEEDDEPIPGGPLCRKDTMALKLDAAPPCKNDISGQTAADRKKLMKTASIKLARKLSERPTADELEQRNILRKKREEQNPEESMEEKRKLLLRKLSFRPTINQLKEQQIIQFNDYVEVSQAEVYDRKGDKPWTRLTPSDKAMIKKELNDFKATEMDVHEESRIFTRFHR